MASLLFIPLGFAVWLLCYGPAVPGRSARSEDLWQQTTETGSRAEHDLAALLQVPDPDPEDTRREG